MSKYRLLGACALCVGMLAVAMPAAAQNAPKVEVSGGYNFLHIDTDGEDDDLANLPAGWYADVAGNLTSMFGIVGQITGNYKTLEDDEIGVEADVKIHTFMAGVRAGGGASNVRPFGQVLFGAVHSKFSSDDLAFEDSSTDPALQLGAGVNVMSGAVGVRLGADYIRVFEENEGTNVFRFGVGIVFGR